MGPDREQISFSLRSKGFIKNESGEWVKANTVAARIQDPKPEQPVREALVNDNEASADGPRRVVVGFTLYRTRLLDYDNAAGSIKAICDALRYCGAIEDDSPDKIQVNISQKKVAHRKDEGTLIEVTYP